MAHPTQHLSQRVKGEDMKPSEWIEKETSIDLEHFFYNYRTKPHRIMEAILAYLDKEHQERYSALKEYIEEHVKLVKTEQAYFDKIRDEDL